MAKRQVVLLGLTLALAAGARAQQQGKDQGALGELFSGDASVRGSVLVRADATQVMSGSQISAGTGMALLKLKRGGQVRICPGTKLSLSADAAGKALSLGIDAGAMELQYQLESGADSLLTPDFRLQLISPGVFHLAISVNSSGDTCLQSLPGADAAVFVTEMMGDESYQLSPGKKVLFHKGRIAGATETPESCGCPQTARAPMAVAESSPPMTAMPLADSQRAATIPAAPPPLPPLPAQPATQEAKAQPVSAPHQDPTKSSAHLEVQSQFTYRGDQPEQDYYTAVARLAVSKDNSRLALALLPQIAPWTEVSVPKPPAPKPHRETSGGFLHGLGGALRRMFGGH